MPERNASSMHPNEVLLEYVRFGNSLRVTAVDAATGTEVIFQAPLAASQSELRKIAVNKLAYVLQKKQATKT
jgi:hypothetical protein